MMLVAIYLSEKEVKRGDYGRFRIGDCLGELCSCIRDCVQMVLGNRNQTTLGNVSHIDVDRMLDQMLC